jgi:surfeit locus 1 family protein
MLKVLLFKRFNLTILLTTIFTSIIIVFFCSLGFWQIERGNEKKKNIHSFNMELAKAPTNFDLKTLPVLYQKIQLTGRFLPQVFLLDNQVYKHKLGYHVLSPMQLANSKIVIVDRGWVPQTRDRNYFPNISSPSRDITLSGYAYYPSKKGMLLGNIIEKKVSNTAVIELIDLKFLSQFLHKSTYPFIIRLNKEERYGYTRDWSLVSMPPERHFAYAFQWFCFAFVAAVLFIFLVYKKKK